MTVLVAVMLLAATASLALVVAGRRRLAVLPLVGEVVMLVAMVDAHWPGLGVVPVLAWAAALTACALATALVDRLRRGVAVEPHGDRLHTVGMLFAAGLLVLGGAPASAAGAHVHGHGGGLALPLLLGLGAYAVAVAFGVRRGTRRERLRRAASAVALLAMGGMALG